MRQRASVGWSWASTSSLGIQISRGGFRSVPALLRGAGIEQAQGRSDERKMRECLREIAKLPLRLRIVFLGEQADIVAQREQTLEQGRCFGVAMLQLVIVGQPKTAGQKNTFPGRQTIDVVLGSITQHEAVDHELPLDRRDRATHPWII